VAFRHSLAASTLVLVMLRAAAADAAPPPPVVVTIEGDHFQISGEGNTVTGLRRAPVAYEGVSDLAAAVREPQPVAASVRLVRSAPPQVIDYVWCVTEDGVLVVGRQVRTLDVASNQYVFTEGDIKRAYPALEASVPWKWIVEIPLGREVGLTLDVRAMAPGWPVRAVFVAPTVTP
jgi:hypothetical protein